MRVVESRLATNTGELTSDGIARSTTAGPWIVVRIEVDNRSPGRVDPSSLGLRLVYPGMLIDDPDDSDSSAPPSTLLGEDAKDFGAPGATSTLTMAFLVPAAASAGDSSLKTTSASGIDEYFRIR